MACCYVTISLFESGAREIPQVINKNTKDL